MLGTDRALAVGMEVEFLLWLMFLLGEEVGPLVNVLGGGGGAMSGGAPADPALGVEFVLLILSDMYDITASFWTVLISCLFWQYWLSLDNEEVTDDEEECPGSGILCSL